MNALVVDALVWLGVAGLLAIGLLALADPIRLSALYGVAVRDRDALVFVRAAGARDVLLGAVLAFAQARASAATVAAVCAACASLAVADLLLCWFHARGFRRELAAHAAGVVGFAILALLVAQR